MKSEQEEELWTEVIHWGVETVKANDEAVQIEWTTLHWQFIDAIGPHIHSHLSRTRRALPIKFYIHLWGLILCVLQHRHGEGWALETPEEVRSFLQHWAVKVFPRGSKAFVWPPLFIKFDNLKDRVKVSFYCEVYNERGTLQWSLAFK